MHGGQLVSVEAGSGDAHGAGPVEVHVGHLVGQPLHDVGRHRVGALHHDQVRRRHSALVHLLRHQVEVATKTNKGYELDSMVKLNVFLQVFSCDVVVDDGARGWVGEGSFSRSGGRATRRATVDARVDSLLHHHKRKFGLKIIISKIITSNKKYSHF